MDFSDALKELKAGHFIRSPGWEKSLYIKKVDLCGNPCLVIDDDESRERWYPVQADFFACDWEVVE